MAATSDARADAPAPFSQRQHILDTALSLMSQHGVDGTSMRDLASAAGLNVATIYHYFSSKRDLLVAVLEERGFVADLQDGDVVHESTAGLAELLAQMFDSLLEVEDFVRLMLGEVMRGEETAGAVGTELWESTRSSLETWLEVNEPELCQRIGAPVVTRIVLAAMVGVFFEYVTGMLDDPAEAFRMRAKELASVLGALN
ncbi:MAG: TetR/AcrR family transcriptional regulator [Acidimicrobiales bacterium]